MISESSWSREIPNSSRTCWTMTSDSYCKRRGGREGERRGRERERERRERERIERERGREKGDGER